MKKTVILISALILLMLSVSAMAQEEDEYEDIESDILEINLFGGVDGPTGDMLEWSDSLGAKTGYNIGFDLGYFLKDPLVFGLGFRFAEYSIAVYEGDEAAADLKHRSYNPNLYLKYYLMPTANFSPYVRADAGLTFLKFTTMVTNVNGDRYRQIAYDPAFSFSFGGGVFLYTSDYGGFFVEGNYHRVAASEVDAEYEGGTYVFGDNLSSWDVHAGVRILIGSGE